MSPTPIVTGLASLAALVGCNHGGAPIIDGQCPPVEAPSLSVAKVTYDSHGSRVVVDFGTVLVGDSRLQIIKLTNCSELEDLTFLKVATDASDLTFSTNLHPGQTLPPLESLPVAVLFAPYSAGDKRVRITVTTDSPITPTFEFDLSGAVPSQWKIVPAPTSIDFGNILVNTSASKSLTVANECGIAISATIGAMQGTDAVLFTTVPAAGALLSMPDQVPRPLTVMFAPVVASTTPYQATFQLPFCSDAASQCAPTVSLRGTGVATCFGLAPSSLDFGVVPTGQTVTKVVTWANSCSNVPIHLIADPAVLNYLADGGTSSSGPFQPGDGGPTHDAVLGPNQSLDFPVTFSSPSPGTFTGELDIRTDDANQANIKIPLTATAGP